MSTTMPGMCALPYLAWVHYHASTAQDYNAASLRSQKAGAEFGQRTQSDFPTLIVHSINSDKKQCNAIVLQCNTLLCKVLQRQLDARSDMCLIVLQSISVLHYRHFY